MHVYINMLLSYAGYLSIIFAFSHNAEYYSVTFINVRYNKTAYYDIIQLREICFNMNIIIIDKSNKKKTSESLSLIVHFVCFTSVRCVYGFYFSFRLFSVQFFIEMKTDKFIRFSLFFFFFSLEAIKIRQSIIELQFLSI